jgi:hypothetical protein
VQKWHFALRKPPFYPLNYGNFFRGQTSDIRFQISDCRLPIVDPRPARNNLRNPQSAAVIFVKAGNLRSNYFAIFIPSSLTRKTQRSAVSSID